jgi:uncharacterized metal-binding protein
MRMNEVLIRERLAEARSKRAMVHVGLGFLILTSVLIELFATIPGTLKFQVLILILVGIMVTATGHLYYDFVIRKYEKELERIFEKPRRKQK